MLSLILKNIKCLWYFFLCETVTERSFFFFFLRILCLYWQSRLLEHWSGWSTPPPAPQGLQGPIGDWELAQVGAHQAWFAPGWSSCCCSPPTPSHANHHVRQDDHDPHVHLDHLRLLAGGAWVSASRSRVGPEQASCKGLFRPPRCPRCLRCWWDVFKRVIEVHAKWCSKMTEVSLQGVVSWDLLGRERTSSSRVWDAPQHPICLKIMPIWERNSYQVGQATWLYSKPWFHLFQAP